jgi:hypothetical protein
MNGENTTPERRHVFVRRGPQALGATGQTMALDAFAARGFSNPQIVLRWREFAGPVLGRLTAPISLSKEGLLTISADPSVAVFLQHQTGQLTQRVNLALGAGLVSKVKVVAGKFQRPPQAKTKSALAPTQRSWAAQTADGVQDPGLKAALLRLAEAVALDAPARHSAPLRPRS